MLLQKWTCSVVRSGNKQPAIDNAEHIGPDDTGDNIEAKRVAGYVWNPDPGVLDWERMTQPTFTGGVTVNSAPTYKDDPTDSVETPKYGKTNSSTHKQQVEADVGTTITALPLPSGAATSTLQTTGNNSLASIDTKLTGPITVTTGGLTDTQLRNSAVPVDTELPAATALSDGVANPTVPGVGSFAMGFDGGSSWYRINSTNATSDALGNDGVGMLTDTRLRIHNGTGWDRARGDITNGLDVDVTRSALPSGAATSAKQLPDNHNVVVTSAPTTAVTGTFFQATQPVSAAALPLPSGAALESGGNLATIAGKDFATQTTLALIKAKTDNIDVALSTRTKPADQQHVIVDSGVTTGLTDTQLRATPVPISGTVNPTTPTALLGFVTTVTTAGVRIQLASNSCIAGIVQAPSTNTGIVYVGGSNVSSSVYGAELQPGQASGIAIDNTNKLYVDSASNGDKVAFFGS